MDSVQLPKGRGAADANQTPMTHVRPSRLLSLLLAVLFTPLPAMASVVEPGPPLPPEDGGVLRRWFGAEGGFEEIACWGLGTGCDGFSADYWFGGQVGDRKTMTPYQDPDGVVRPFPARTGNRLWLAAVPGGDASLAYLSTSGSTGPFDGGTVTFSLRVPVLPQLPVVIYRHNDPDILKTLTLTLTPQGDLLMMMGLGTQGLVKGRIQPFQWHSLTLSYGPLYDTFKLWLDGTLELDRSLKEGGPGGHVSLGIVNPTSVPFAIGLDDYVESPLPDAPLLGARVNYLLPEGNGGRQEWRKRFFTPAGCYEVAENWHLVSEDHGYSAPDASFACSFDGRAVETAEAHRVDDYRLEGIPSSHQPTAIYKRDLTIQPRLGDAILGVRTRMRGATDGAPLTWTLSVLDGGGITTDEYTFKSDDSYQLWGPTHETRPSAGEWTIQALDKAKLRLDSGDIGLINRRVGGVRLDYVWVPGFYTGG